MKILYLYIQTKLLIIADHLFLGFVRISNYLNSRKDELNESIEEAYLDLRYEDLPQFIPENIDIYRKKLKTLLKNVYNNFCFDLVAISCYASLNYIPSIEIANCIKKFINPESIIVVGGVHPSISPEDFQIGNFPEIIYEEYSRKTTPFDYIIPGEGELPFFKLVRGLINNSCNKRDSAKNPCIILKGEHLADLGDLPPLDFSLFEKCKPLLENIDISAFSIDFSRGCPYRCRFCYNSGTKLNYLKIIRIKPIELCIKELDIIKNTEWIKINKLFITDMIFFPKRSKRNEFFRELKKYTDEEGPLPFKLLVMDRLELCTIEDLKNYKNLNIVPIFGLETFSKTLLYRMGKILGKNREVIFQGIERHLRKFEEFVKISSELDIEISFFYIIGAAGSTEETFNESYEYLFKKRVDGKALIEKYKINFTINKYTIYKDTEFYNSSEKEFGTIFIKDWWKIFDKYVVCYPAIVDPSSNFSLIDSFSKNARMYNKISKAQLKLGNKFYEHETISDSSDDIDTLVKAIQHRKKKVHS